jgi:hypothetical protein
MSSIYDRNIVGDSSNKNSNNQMIEQIWNDAFREISRKCAAKTWKPNPSAVKFKKRLAAAKNNAQLPVNVTRLGKFFEHDVRGNNGGPHGVRKFKRKKPKRSGELETVDSRKIKSVVSKSVGYQQCQMPSHLPKNMKILKFLKSQLAAVTYASQQQQERHLNKCCCHCACSKLKNSKNNNDSKPRNGIDENVSNFLTDCSGLNFGEATSKHLSTAFAEPSHDRSSTPAFAQNLLDFAAGHHLQKLSKQNHQHCQQRFVEPNQRICMKETRSVVRLVSVGIKL